jgi:hypothetical protein
MWSLTLEMMTEGVENIWTYEGAWRSSHSDEIREERFEVIMAVTIEITVFWYVIPCTVVEYYHNFGGTFCLHL